MIIRLPAVLTADEFAFLTRYNTEVIRRKCRARVIKAYGNPLRIPPKELLAFGVSLDDAAVALHGRAEKKIEKVQFCA